MSKFNNIKIDRDLPIGTKLIRISDPYSNLKVGTICYFDGFVSSAGNAICLKGKLGKFDPTFFEVYCE